MSVINLQNVEINQLTLPIGIDLGTAPNLSQKKGLIAYNVTDDSLYFSNGTSFNQLGIGAGPNNYNVQPPTTAINNDGITVNNTFNTITMQNASSTFGGILTNSTQSIVGEKTLVSNLNLNGGAIVPTGETLSIIDPPVLNNDAVNKLYVDSIAINGTSPLLAAQCATTIILPNTPIYDPALNTLTGSGGVAVLSIDGVALVVSDGLRALVKNQVDPRQNGVWTRTVNSGGNWVLLRTTDFDNPPSETLVNKSIFVTGGTTNINTGWLLFKSVVQFFPSLPTPGSSDVIWTQASGSQNLQAGSGMNQIGNTFNVVGTTNRIAVGAAVNIDPNYVGQNSITTLGTVGTGVWNGTVVSPTFGGSGLSNPTTNNVLISGGAGVYTLKANPASAFVGLTDTQILTNKTLTSNTNTITAQSLFVSSGAASVSTFVAPVPSIGQVLTANSTTTAIWSTPSVATPGWNLTGNAGINPAINFIGATDNQTINISTNGVAGNNRLLISNNGRIEPVNGRSSTFLGFGAGSTLGGTQNVFIGGSSGSVCTSSNNSGVGNGCLNTLLSGGENCGFGSNCLTALSTGVNNCGFGVSCMPSMNASSNTAYGFQTGFSMTGGSLNTLIGNLAGFSITSGSNNICIGSSAGGTVGDYSNSILIGNTANGTSNVIRIGLAGTHNTNFQSGIRGVLSTGVDQLPVQINSLGQLGTNGNYFTENSIVGTVSGIWIGSLAYTIRFVKNGPAVTMFLPTVASTFTSGTTITWNTIIPTIYNPLSARDFIIPLILGGANNLGRLSISPAGNITVQVVTPGVWNAGNAGIFATCVTYAV